MEDDYGAGVWLWAATNNTFYGNKFVNNAQQVFVFDQAINIWSTGPDLGGNYWSDYIGIDVDGNKIGDSPYVIDVANSDPYPLIAQPSGGSPINEDEVEQQSQIPFEYIIVLGVVVGIIVLLAFVFRKRK